MARALHRLSALAVSREQRPGHHADGGGLYLQISKKGAKSWVYRFMLNGCMRDMGLGSVRDIGLSKARALASENRALKAQKIDPIEARRAALSEARQVLSGAISFEECALKYIALHKPSWRNAKHGTQWENTLKSYAHPTLGKLSVGAIQTQHVMKVLEPIWFKKPVTAKRLRARLETILDWATACGYRKGENPARWKGHVANLLPRTSKIRKVRHHPALPYTEIGALGV